MVGLVALGSDHERSQQTKTHAGAATAFEPSFQDEPGAATRARRFFTRQ